ncbi:thiamine pyrophosphate-binding protein [Paroceanicella profunda]|uniref:Thiamine pyrophosphate-binding protein n=1 Tax=Paroceanicella profunda TaxID=2579971 RepID=A0A5B8FH51_9RHOB|nr:thiamine pyrophosphate-binding protein [Paroceanicella profunda]QDL91618.1 thiamine pyrophosphate-binding protein [Paroceanicella profunda]
MTTSADIIAARLHAAGVRHAFGLPGGEVVALIEALERAGIRFVLARHENAAGFMAEGAWHGSGAPAVLVATVGPGMANCVNVTANAQQDRVPLIVLTGRIPEAEALGFSHQVLDQQAVLRPLVKASFEAREGACDLLIDKALAIATDAVPGPVHIDLPIPVATAPHAPDRQVRRARPAPAAPAEGAALEAARAAFAAAARPVILAGMGLLESPGGAARLRETAERFGIPVLTTYKAKGLLDESGPLALGGHGLSPRSDAIVLPLLARADLVIACGYDPIEMRAGWRQPWDPARCIAFAAAPDTQYMHGADLAWVCDPAAGLASLIRDAAPKPLWPDRAPDQARAALAAAFAPGQGWGPAAAFHAIAAARPEGCVTAVDTGAHRILLSQILACAAPRTLLQSTGLCTMGCALPLAMGHRLARPDVPALVVTGDGALDMILGELATLRDLALPIPVVVMVDGSLALIEMKQRADGRPNAGVDFGVTDYAAVAGALGLAGQTVSDAAALGAALDEAFRRDGPSVIAVQIPRQAYDGRI